MKALVLTSPETIEIADVEKPQPKSGEALVRIKAAALNHRDEWCREGKYPNIHYGVTLGSDGAGIVEEVGENVDKDWLEKEVIINPNIDWGSDPAAQSQDYKILGMPFNGTFAEYVVVKEDRLCPKPSHLNFIDAAALPLGGLTAYRAVFTHGKANKNKSVLISGVGGGVAQFAFLFCKAVGARVYITSGSQQKIERMVKQGALAGFNYKEENWPKKALKETGGFDLIIDSAGGNQLNALIAGLKPAGKIVFYGATTGVPSSLNLHKLFWNQSTLQGSTMGNDEEFAAMIEFVGKHKIEPIIDSVRPFDHIVEAFDTMKAGQQTGKLVVEF